MRNRGVSALFAGPPGVGKTMVAGIIGRELGLDVHRVVVSRILSKWVGETEKNLAQLFDESTRTRTVLVFDEADALFSKRTEVKSSADRYSNVEVNYLLQRMEAFEGVLILTTNQRRGIDDAFARRLNFKIVFPEPSVEERQEMWRRMIPSGVELDADVRLEELAHVFDATGGFIKNAVVRAALIARSAGAARPRLSRAHLLRAIAEESEEMGRVGRDARSGERGGP